MSAKVSIGFLQPSRVTENRKPLPPTFLFLLSSIVKDPGNLPYPLTLIRATKRPSRLSPRKDRFVGEDCGDRGCDRAVVGGYIVA